MRRSHTARTGWCVWAYILSTQSTHSVSHFPCSGASVIHRLTYRPPSSSNTSLRPCLSLLFPDLFNSSRGLPFLSSCIPAPAVAHRSTSSSRHSLPSSSSLRPFPRPDPVPAPDAAEPYLQHKSHTSRTLGPGGRGTLLAPPSLVRTTTYTAHGPTARISPVSRSFPFLSLYLLISDGDRGIHGVNGCAVTALGGLGTGTDTDTTGQRRV